MVPFFVCKTSVSFWVLYPMAMEMTVWNPRHTFTTRYLFSGISSHLYYGQWTVDDLLGELANEAIDAFERGVYDPLGKQKFILFFCSWFLISFTVATQSCWPCLAFAAQEAGGNTLRLVNIGTKGDWPFLRKASYLKIMHNIYIYIEIIYILYIYIYIHIYTYTYILWVYIYMRVFKYSSARDTWTILLSDWWKLNAHTDDACYGYH